MELVKELIAKLLETKLGPFVLYLFGISLSIVLLVSAYAALEGREVSFWPIKIGPRPCDNDVFSCQENIGLNIDSPKDGAMVDNPIAITGTVSNTAESFLWVTAYHKLTNTYTDLKQIVPNDNNRWRQELKLIGGATGDAFLIDVFSVSEAGNKQLMHLRNTHSPTLPDDIFDEKYSKCRQITVQWQYNSRGDEE